jgi:release factor glutamine methyltransferase
MSSKVEKILIWIFKNTLHLNVADYTTFLKEELLEQFSERELQNHISLLYEHFLNLNRSQTILSQQRDLSAEELKQLNEAVAKIKAKQPIDYILGESIFFGRPFLVDERVLIPRPETEELVLWVLEEEKGEGLTVLDIGSGSGCIPVTLSLEGVFEKIVACDVSEEANEVALINAKELHATIEVRRIDILKEVPGEVFDIVVSNPPYVKEEELEYLDENVVDYEPRIALAPEGDPLTFYKRMIACAPVLLKEGGRFYWEIHEELGKEVVQLLEDAGFIEIELRKDLFDRDRLVKAVYPG